MTPRTGAGSALIVVTDRGQAAAAGHSLMDVVVAAVDGGARTVLLREKDLPRAGRGRLAEDLLAVLAPAGGSLLVAGDLGLARSVGATGVHLAAADPWPPSTRASAAGVVPSVGGHRDSPQEHAGQGPVPQGLRRGRSCHSEEELRAVQAAGLDYATFSPVWPTESKPGYGPVLGSRGLAAGCRAVAGFPVYALGGVGPGRMVACFEAGAAGVAVMGAIMRADDPAKVVRTLLEEIP